MAAKFQVMGLAHHWSLASRFSAEKMTSLGKLNVIA
jgi:hypothetical protein